MNTLSIIIPAFDEAGIIEKTLCSLQGIRAAGHEVIVVDGGSSDNTLDIAQTLADKVISSEKGRANQMNAGAKNARGDVLLFMHADSTLPPQAEQLILEGLQQSNKQWGRFDVQLSGKHFLFRIIEQLMNLRSRLSGIITGDQGIFVRDDAFRLIGGFPDIKLMEDIAISKKLKRHHGRPLCLHQKLVTSSRRWEQQGIIKTILLMWRLRFAYFLGTDPAQLAQNYR